MVTVVCIGRGEWRDRGKGKLIWNINNWWKNFPSARSFPIRLWARLEDSSSKTHELTVQVALIRFFRTLSPWLPWLSGQYPHRWAVVLRPRILNFDISQITKAKNGVDLTKEMRNPHMTQTHNIMNWNFIGISFKKLNKWNNTHKHKQITTHTTQRKI